MKVAQSCPTLCHAMHCTLHGILQTRGGSLSLLQGIFPTQGSSIGLPHCRWILYQLSQQGSPKNTGVSSLSLLQGIFPAQGSNPGFPHCRWILYQLSHKGSPRILECVACPFSSISSCPRNQTRVSCIAGGFFCIFYNFFLFPLLPLPHPCRSCWFYWHYEI